MLTLLKKIFVWWNQETLGTKLKTLFFGKLVGTDSTGNKYYESKDGKRWVIYSDEIDASKIPNEWYSWIHFTKNKIEKQIEDGNLKHKKMDVSFGKELQKKRLSKGMTQKDLAQKLNIPVKDINDIESGIVVLEMTAYSNCGTESDSS